MMEAFITALISSTSYTAAFWGVLGLFFIICELIVPGFFLLWLGIAALLTGGITCFFPLDFSWTCGIFAALSMVILFFTRHAYKRLFQFTSHGTLNQRVRAMVGSTLVLEEPIKNGRGRLRIGDSMWGIKGGEDLAKGTAVTITAVEGNHLIVEKVRE